MLTDATTWIVIADGRESRGYEERVRHGALHGLADLHLHVDSLASATHAHTATAHARRGDARHGAGDRDPASDREARFLAEVAAQLEAAAIGHRFQHLVLMAPPKALGLLRNALGPHATARLQLTEPHNRLPLPEEELRKALHAARLAG